MCRSDKTPIRLKQRLSLVLLADEGLTNMKIANRVPVNPMTISVWQNRFADEGLNGIVKNRSRGAIVNGARDDSYVKLLQKIIEVTTTEKPEGETHWITRTVAAKLGTNPMFVSRVWRDNGLKRYLVKSFKVSNSLLFEEKLTDVVGLYLSLPENAVVFRIDEKSSIQALDRTQPGLPMKKERAGTMTHDYKRHGTCCFSVYISDFVPHCHETERLVF